MPYGGPDKGPVNSDGHMLGGLFSSMDSAAISALVSASIAFPTARRLE
jgi:hypothetical protein